MSNIIKAAIQEGSLESVIAGSNIQETAALSLAVSVKRLADMAERVMSTVGSESGFQSLEDMAFQLGQAFENGCKSSP